MIVKVCRPTAEKIGSAVLAVGATADEKVFVGFAVLGTHPGPGGACVEDERVCLHWWDLVIFITILFIQIAKGDFANILDAFIINQIYLHFLLIL